MGYLLFVVGQLLTHTAPVLTLCLCQSQEGFARERGMPVLNVVD